MYYEKFAELCQKRNVTAADIARGTGIATATLTSWKKGRYTPKIDKLQNKGLPKTLYLSVYFIPLKCKYSRLNM